jgi:hypothetical protein
MSRLRYEAKKHKISLIQIKIDRDFESNRALKCILYNELLYYEFISKQLFLKLFQCLLLNSSYLKKIYLKALAIKEFLFSNILESFFKRF